MCRVRRILVFIYSCHRLIGSKMASLSASPPFPVYSSNRNFLGSTDKGANFPQPPQLLSSSSMTQNTLTHYSVMKASRHAFAARNQNVSAPGTAICSSSYSAMRPEPPKERHPATAELAPSILSCQKTIAIRMETVVVPSATLMLWYILPLHLQACQSRTG